MEDVERICEISNELEAHLIDQLLTDRIFRI
jgi:hypothetical protein